MGDRMHCQTQDIVVAGLGKDLGDMPLDRPFAEIELLGYLLSGLRLADQTQDIYLDLGQLHTVGDDALPARGNVEYPSMVERMIARSSPVPTFL